MKIAMIGQKRIPSREGGVEIAVEELATRMVTKQNSVTCFNRSGHSVAGAQFDPAPTDSYRGVILKKVATVDRRGLAAASSSFFASVKAAFGDFDIVHYHAEGPACMCWIPKLFGKRVIVTVHGLDWARAKWGGFAAWYIRNGEKNAVRFADEIIVLSRNVQKYFQDRYGRGTVFIHNGVNEPTLVPAETIRNQWGLEKDGYILYLGRLVPEKGIHYLIEAYIKADTDKKLVIAGGLSDSPDYADKLKKMSTKVIFTGFQQGNVLAELLSNAYIYCLPSELEGMPLSLLEAMSYGNCCLVSDIPECVEVVADDAVYFKKGDVQDLTCKLQKLCDDPDLVDRYKKADRGAFLRNYSWDTAVDRTLAVYKGEQFCGACDSTDSFAANNEERSV